MLPAGPIRLLLTATIMMVVAEGPVRSETQASSAISNVATCRYLSGPGDSNPDGAEPPVEPATVLSNEVLTPVVARASLSGLTLAVDPAGTVAPAQTLRYSFNVRNGPDEPLSQVELLLPVDPGLGPPLNWTDGFVPVEGGQLQVTGVWDSTLSALRWQLPQVGAGQQFTVETHLPVLTSLPPETVITMQGSLDATELLTAEDSNVVTSTVMPPLLEVVKLADRTTAVPGDGVVYRLRVTHTGAEPALEEVELVDTLPHGLRFVTGSAQVDGQPASAIEEQDGRQVRIHLGPLEPGEARQIRLATVVGPLAGNHDAVNTAIAQGLTAGGTAVQSPEASASVRIVPGPFRQEAYLLGRVFMDTDGNGLPGEQEAGVPGVLVHLEDGRGAVTDITGRWHIEGVRPGLHVARIDPASLPDGIQPAAGGAEWVGDADTRFIDARASTLVVADFPMLSANPASCQVSLGQTSILLPAASLIDGEGYPRSQATPFLDQAAAWLFESRGAERLAAPQLSCATDAPVPPETSAELQVRLQRAAQGRLQADVPGLAAPPQPRRQPSALQPPDTRLASPADVTIEDLLRNLPAQAAIVEPANQSLASRSHIDVLVVLPAGARPRLSVNGRPVPDERIGAHSVLPARGIEGYRYVGVLLDEGPNRLHLSAVDPKSRTGEQAESTAVVYLPGPAVALRLTVPEGRWIADGRTPAVLRVESIDGAGQISRGREMVTVHVEGGRPLGTDADPAQEGWQIRLLEGKGQLRLAPLLLPGQLQVQAYSETLEAETIVPVVPGGGDWTVFGLAEGTWAGGAGVEGDGGKAPGITEDITDSGGRLAFMARGPVGEASRLTVSVDTARDADQDRLFGPYEPEAFFPAPGDSSVRVDQAQSQGRVFIRLDAPMGFAQWGDFNSGFRQTELARYDRRLTGLSGEFTRGRFNFSGFAAHTDQLVVRDVFSPDGTSGPFLLRRTPVVARSESVIVETRDRFRSEEVIARQVKLRDIDYTLDPVSGTILFRGPVAPFDAALNPVRVVVLYETRGAVEDHITAGGRVVFRPSPSLEAGASLVHEGRDGEPLQLAGVDLGWRPLPGLQLQTEMAYADDGSQDAIAYRLQLNGRRGAHLDWEVAYRDLPLDFANPTLLASPEIGTRRASAVARWRPVERLRLRAEALLQDDERTGLERAAVGLEAEQEQGPVTLLGAVRGVRGQRPGEAEGEAVLVEAGVRGRFARVWTAELLRRQVFGDDNVPGYPTRTSAGLSWEIRDGIRALLRHEIESGDGPDRDRTMVGLESRIGTYSRSFARYALQQGIDGASVRSTTGIETSLPLSPSSFIHLSAARVDTSRGDTRADFTSLAGGYEFQTGATRVSSRYEVRIGETHLRHFLTASAAMRSSPSWTLFVRERLSYLQPDSRQDALRAEGLLGLSFRPAAGHWRFLARLEHSIMSGNSTLAAGVQAGVGGVLGLSRPGLGFDDPRYEAGVSHDSFAVTLATGTRLTARQRLAASLIVRLVDDGTLPELPATLSDLLSLHYTAVVRKRWTVGGSLRRFAVEDLHEARFGAGFEIGYLMFRNLWVTGGYNVAGFRTPDWPNSEETERGPFLSFRFKFDENDFIPWRNARLDAPGESPAAN